MASELSDFGPVLSRLQTPPAPAGDPSRSLEDIEGKALGEPSG